MRLGRVIGLAIVLIVLLFMSATYVGYSNKANLMRDRGVWDVHLSGNIRLIVGNLYVTIDSMRAHFDSSPDIPSFQEYLSEMFKLGNSEPIEVKDNETFVEFRLLITFDGKGLDSKVLYDKEIKVPYVWAGGSIDENGLIYSFSYDSKQEIAYYEFSPYKIVAKAYLDDSLRMTETEYLTIEQPEGVG